MQQLQTVIENAFERRAEITPANVDTAAFLAGSAGRAPSRNRSSKNVSPRSIRNAPSALSGKEVLTALALFSKAIPSLEDSTRVGLIRE